MFKIPALKIREQSPYGIVATYKEKQTDFIIKVEDETILVHKDFLCVVSEYFRVMVESGFTESEDGMLRVQNTNPHVVQAIIRYLYDEEISIPWSDVREFVDFAELWQIPELKSSLGVYIAKHISASDSVEWYHFANMYNLKEVKPAIKEVLSSSYMEAFKSEYFQDLEYEEFVDFIKNELLSHNAALEACISWTISEESRKPGFEKLLLHVLISECNPARLAFIVQHGLVTSQSVCKEINDIVASSVILMKGYPERKAFTLNMNNTLHFDVFCISGSYSSIPTVPALFEMDHAKLKGRIFTIWEQEATYKCMLWNPSTLEVEWLPSISLLSDLISIKAASVNNKIYIMFERSGNNVKIVYLDTSSRGEWEELSMPWSVRRAWDCEMCSEGKLIFILTGTKKLYCYDTDDDTWSEKSDPGVMIPGEGLFDLIHLSLVPALGCLYIIGKLPGKVDKDLKRYRYIVAERPPRVDKYPKLYCYSIASDTWTELSRPPSRPLQYSMSQTSCFVESLGEIYDFDAYFWYDNMVQVYNIAADAWREVACRPYNRMSVRNMFCFTV